MMYLVMEHGQTRFVANHLFMNGVKLPDPTVQTVATQESMQLRVSILAAAMIHLMDITGVSIQSKQRHASQLEVLVGIVNVWTMGMYFYDTIIKN